MFAQAAQCMSSIYEGREGLREEEEKIHKKKKDIDMIKVEDWSPWVVVEVRDSCPDVCIFIS